MWQQILDWFTGNYAAKQRAYRHGLLRAHADAAQILAEARSDGYSRGFVEGRQFGEELGRETGQLAGENIGRQRAFHAVMEAYGMLRAGLPATWQIPADQKINWGPHPNVYRIDDKYVVRIVIGSVRRTGSFIAEKPGSDGMKMALMAALRWRRAQHMTEHSTLTQMIMQDITAQLPPSGVSPAQLAVEFHRCMVDRIANEMSCLHFFGQDPSTWLPKANRAILSMRLPFPGTSAVVYDAMCELGLEDRTVRDLLLCTAAELGEIRRIGPATLRQVRQQLASFGLALWGDPVPADPAAEREVREQRLISLD